MLDLPLDPNNFSRIVFFTGAGMSAESGVPTYRGEGGIWKKYNWEEYACQEAFDINPDKVLKFHETRRKAVLECKPHDGHKILSRIVNNHSHAVLITQNIDGMHQLAGSTKVIELHGSLWRLRCFEHGLINDTGQEYSSYTCLKCERWLRPDIVWFGDMLDPEVTEQAMVEIKRCDLFVSIGTSANVWPAAGYPEIAKNAGALCIEINPELTSLSALYDLNINKVASQGLKELFS